jgi:hypothetical protein
MQPVLEPSAHAKPPYRKPSKRRRPNNRAKVSSKPAMLPGVDGRTLLARRFYDITAAIFADQGGVDRCTEVKIVLIRNYAAAAATAEALNARMAMGEPVDIDQLAKLSSTLVRLASKIGVRRHAKLVPHLGDYIEGRVEPDEVDA